MLAQLFSNMFEPVSKKQMDEEINPEKDESQG
jgi:hypothetical protein